MRRTKVATLLVDRANYGRLKPVMEAIEARPDLEQVVVCAGSMVLERFDRPVRVVQADGFNVVGELFVELDGSVPVTMAKSLGLSVLEFASELRRLQPDVVLLIGDRFEALGAALAAAYSNHTLVHLQGGEVSGSVDESARHAITRFAHWHVPATQRARDYLVRMGERADSILTVGCPSSDLARRLDRTLDAGLLEQHGSGASIDPARPFRLVVFHPDTTDFGTEREQMEALLGALLDRSMPTLMLWPNIDAGSNVMSKVIRQFRDRHQPDWLRLVTNLAPDDYLRVLAAASVAVGNSSSFVRDASFFGTPVVLVGARQDGRERDRHVLRVAVERAAIASAMDRQRDAGRYAASALYGDGHVAERVAAALPGLGRYVKRLDYVAREDG